MGEAPGREDGAVTRSAEVTSFISLFICLSVFPNLVCHCMKYVGSFPVDDRCLDDQILQLHTQLKALKVSSEFLLNFKFLSSFINVVANVAPSISPAEGGGLFP